MRAIAHRRPGLIQTDVYAKLHAKMTVVRVALMALPKRRLSHDLPLSTFSLD